jgi:thermitase
LPPAEAETEVVPVKPITRLWIFAACAAWAGTATAQAAPDAGRFAAGRVLAMPKAGLTGPQVDRLLRSAGGQGRRVGASDLYIVAVPPGSERAVANLLGRNPHFKFAELDHAVAPGLAVNDPYAGSQWHLGKIAAAGAWDSSQGAGVTIAILDSGIDSAHADLAGRLVSGWNFYDNSANTADVTGHGTKVAGAAAAATNNGMGVAAVAGQASIMPIRITDSAGYAYWSTLAQGITHAADRGARIANASFAASGSSAVQSASQYMKNKGGLVFISAGNDGAQLAIVPTTALITVAATDSTDARTSWSNYGDVVRLAAPGASIYTTTVGGGYGAVSGTSFSAPIAAGVAALVMAAKPSLSSNAVETLLTSTAVDLGAAGRDPLFGHGRVDAAAAVRAALASGSTTPDTQAPQVTITNPGAGATVSGLLAVDTATSDNVGVTRVDLLANGAVVASDTVAPFAFNWDTTRAANGTSTLEARAYDAAGNAAASARVGVNVANGAPPITADTQPPVVTIGNPKAGSKVKGNVTISANASDNAGAAGIRQSLYVDGTLVAQTTGASLSYNWAARKAAAGAHQIQVVARDAAGNTNSVSVAVYR